MPYSDCYNHMQPGLAIFNPDTGWVLYTCLVVRFRWCYGVHYDLNYDLQLLCMQSNF